MSIVRWSVAVVCLLALVVSVPADDKTIDKDKIIGTWEIVKSQGGVPAGTTVEFTKDGKIVVKVKADDKVVTLPGTYTIDGDKLKTVVKVEGAEMKETMTIKTLTDKELVTVNEKGDKDEFKKK